MGIFTLSIFILCITLVFGVSGYHILSEEPITLVDSLYMTIITLSTVGYGEIIDLSQNPEGRIFTMILILLGMSNLLYVLSSLSNLIVQGHVQEYFKRRKQMKKITEFDQHFIVCGAGNTGHHIISELIKNDRDFVVIEKNPEVVETLKNQYMDAVILEGDASDDQTLIQAGIEKAEAIASVLPYDKDNLFLTITAKHLNKNCRIISKVMSLDNTTKLKRAGANAVVPPQFIGALRLVSELIRPTVVSFLDNMLRQDDTVRIEEVLVPTDSWICEKEIKDLQIPQKVGVQIIAIKAKLKNKINYSPKSDELIHPNDTLITIASPEQIESLKAYISKK